jgi:hypothetical protein
MIHGTIVNTKSVSFTVLVLLSGSIKETAETRDADAAEDAEDFALMVVEFGGCFAAKGEELFAEKGLHAG